MRCYADSLVVVPHSAEPLRFPSFPPLVRVAGAVPLCVGLSLISFPPRDLILSAIGLVIAALGVVFTFGRRSLVIDPARARVFDAVGLLVTMFEWRSLPFQAFNVVSFGLRVTTVDGAGNAQYWVGLSGPTHKRGIAAVDNFLEARRTAEQVAKVMGLGVLDQATLAGYREPGSLDVSLRQRLLSAGTLPPLGPLPPRFSTVPGARGWSFSLPRAPLLPQLGNSFRWFLFAIMAQIVTVIRLTGLTHPRVANDPSMTLLGDAFGVLGILVAACVLALFIRELRVAERYTTVHVSPHGLHLELRGMFGTRRVTLDSNALETLGVGRRVLLPALPSLGPERIVAASDQRVITFGIGCTPAERTWLIHAIWHALISHRIGYN